MLQTTGDPLIKDVVVHQKDWLCRNGPFLLFLPSVFNLQQQLDSDKILRS